MCVCLGLTCSLTLNDAEGETADSRFLCADGDNGFLQNVGSAQLHTTPIFILMVMMPEN